MAASPNLKILIAEDDALVALSLRGQLTELGHDVVGEARNGEEAVHLTTETSPDVILMDIKMPDMDGLTASRTIMEQNPTAIVILTSYADDAFIRAADLVGVMNYLVKPVDEKELAPALRIAHSRFREMLDLRREAESAQQALRERKIVERAKGILMRRLGIGEEEAYEHMRRKARDRRIKMAELAQTILAADDVL